MILDASRLLKRKVEVLPFNVSYEADFIEREDFELKLKSPILVSGEAYYDGEIVRMKGNIKTLIEAQCSRCLKNIDYPLEINFEEEFSKAEHEDAYPIMDNDDIDLKNMVIDNLILSIPLRLLCSENCKGLCPKCGKNLNTGSCNCEKDDVDPRLAVLKDLFKGS